MSFLNSHSGTIYIGVNDKGEVIGVDNYDEVALKISDRIRTNIAPSTEGLININIECIKKKLSLLLFHLESKNHTILRKKECLYQDARYE